MNRNSNLLFWVMVCLVVSTLVFGTSNRITPALEWICALYVINFYAIMAFTNPFYDSILDGDSIVNDAANQTNL